MMRVKSVGNIILVVFLSSVFMLKAPDFALAREVKIVFTGQSYAMLYPCQCPVDPDGGIARRAASIKDIRAASPDAVFVEAGSSFGSGQMDLYAKNYEEDMRRTEIYLKGLKLMNYDALLLSGQEFSFGAAFIEKYPELPFVSSNIHSWKKSFVLKDLGWIKIGILGLTDSLAQTKGAEGFDLSKPVISAKVKELKNLGAGLVIVLSALSPDEDLKLLKDIKGIDVVINGSPSYVSVNLEEAGGFIHLRTWWQARRIGVLSLDMIDGKIRDKKLESIRLGSEVADDKDVSAILPQCFSEGDCKRTAGMTVKCENPGTEKAQCSYIQSQQLSLTVIEPKVCNSCRVEDLLTGMQNSFGKMKIERLFEDDPRAKSIIEEFGLTMLPAYLFSKDIKESQYFSSLEPVFEEGREFYLVKPEKSGVSYLLGRKRVPKRLDVIFGFDNRIKPELFMLLKEFAGKHRDVNVRIHLLAIPDEKNDGEFLARGGSVAELEELMRIACIDTLYPGKVFDYLACRAGKRQSGWWDSCLPQALKNKTTIIKDCALSGRGKNAMKSHTQLTQELKIASGPTFIIDNTEIFGIIEVPPMDEFEKVVLGVGKEENKKRGNHEN